MGATGVHAHAGALPVPRASARPRSFSSSLPLQAVLLSVDSASPQTVFAVIFAIVWLGAFALTLNVILLGGRIIFFQSVAVLGYCLFPLDMAALLCLAWRNKVYQSVLLLCSALWSLRCSVPFIAATVSERRRALAVYPVLLLYTSIAALALSVSS